jgi:hypothetical protein
MPLRGINEVFTAPRTWDSVPQSMPRVPDHIAQIRDAQARGAGDKGWTGLNFMQANSASDVKEHLADERDAARVLVSADQPMFLLRYSYGTHKSMEAWLHQKPANGKLKLTVTTMPSWHAGARGVYGAKSALNRLTANQQGVPKLSADQIEQAMKADSSFAKVVEDNLAPLDRAAAWFSRTYDDFVATESPTPAEAKEFLGELMDDIGTEAMGEKFSRENIYNVRIRLPDGKTITKRFDTEGNDPPKSGRLANSNNATNSPEIEIDISGFDGKDVIIQAWPDGSAGVGGYKEAREIKLHL